MSKSWRTIPKKFVKDMTDTIKAYIIVERSLVYNDNTYDVNDGEPRKAFLSKQEAIKEFNKMNSNALRGWHNLTEIEGVWITAHLASKIKEYGGKIERSSSGSNFYIEQFDPSNLTDEEALDILKMVDFYFYYIKEVELE